MYVNKHANVKKCVSWDLPEKSWQLRLVFTATKYCVVKTRNELISPVPQCYYWRTFFVIYKRYSGE